MQASNMREWGMMWMVFWKGSYGIAVTEGETRATAFFALEMALFGPKWGPRKTKSLSQRPSLYRLSYPKTCSPCYPTKSSIW